MDFESKAVIVTGSGRRIGKEIAKLFARNGADVACTDLHFQLAQKTANEIAAEGGRAVVIKTDVTRPKEVEEMVSTVVKKLGRIDVLVNNAGGTMELRRRALEDVTDEDWDKIVRLNLYGVFNCCRATVPYMKKQRYGKIINIGSGAGFQWGAARTGIQAYAAAKAGVMGFTRHLAYELAGYNINVNCISPGIILTNEQAAKYDGDEYTKAIPLNRIGRPEDVANVVLFIASDEASYITGQTLMVNGGRMMR